MRRIICFKSAVRCDNIVTAAKTVCKSILLHYMTLFFIIIQFRQLSRENVLNITCPIRLNQKHLSYAVVILSYFAVMLLPSVTCIRREREREKGGVNASNTKLLVASRFSLWTVCAVGLRTQKPGERWIKGSLKGFTNIYFLNYFLWYLATSLEGTVPIITVDSVFGGLSKAMGTLFFFARDVSVEISLMSFLWSPEDESCLVLFQQMLAC